MYLLKYFFLRRANMRKIRILALLLAVLMIPFSLLVACKKDSGEDDECATKGHDWNKKEVTIEKRTCTTSGIKERTCRVCKLTEQYEWKPEGHTISRAEWIYNEDALCTVDGTETRSCALCTYTETRSKAGTMLGHTFTHYALSEDGYSETAACDRCSEATDTRLVGIDIDFEGEKNTLSYGAFTVYTAAGVTDYYKTEGEDETFNSYLEITRTTDIGIGDHGYGAVFAPGYQRLKANKYVADFDVIINKDNTGDLVLLQGNKELTSVDFLTYDAETHTVSITYGPIYTLKDTDYDRWLKFSLVLNDIERKYELYIDGKLVISGVDYQNDDYFAGMDLNNFKIGMTHEVGVASTFALDNIDIYIGNSPKGYTGATLDPDYAVFETDFSKNKIMYKKLDSGCTHVYGDTVTVDADCYNDGYSYKECSECLGRTELATVGAKLSHMLDGVSTMVDDGKKVPTCTEYGALYKKCTLCGYKDKESIAMLPHIIDTDAPSYLNVPATCLADGYIKGECINCHCELNNFNGEYKFGHNIVDKEVVTVANCVADGYSEGKCINPGCGITVKSDEVSALGHVMKTVIKDDDKLGKVMENFCIRCQSEEYTLVQALGTPGVFPTLADVQAALGDNLYGGIDGNGFANGAMSTGSKYSAMRFHSDDGSSSAGRVTEGGNTFLRINHGGQGYLNFTDDMKKKQDIVLEFSLKLPTTGNAPGAKLTVAHREPSGHQVVFTMLRMEANGELLFDPSGSNVLIGNLNSEAFTKLSFVVKQASATVDVYVNGALVIQNHLMKKGNTEFVLPMSGIVYEYRFLLDNVSGTSKILDVDDMYLYHASVPVYVTNPFLPNAADTNYSITANETSGSGAFIPNNRVGIIGSKMNIVSNKGFRAYVEEVTGAAGTLVNALHCVKGDSVTNIAGANTSKNESEITTVNSILNNTGAVIYNEIKFNAGSFTGGTMNSGKIILAQGRKVANSSTIFETFLYVENGILYTGAGKGIGAVKQDEWISYNVVVNEADFTYDVYINGICQASGVKFANAGYAVAIYSQIGYKFIYIDGGEFDFHIAGTAIYAGALAPVSDVVVASVEQLVVKTEVEQKFEAVKFYADQSTYVYYDYVGKMVANGGVLTTLSDSALYAKQEAVSIATIDGRNVLRTTNYKTNNLKAIEFDTLTNVKLVGNEPGVYDLSGYKYMVVTLNVEETTGYNIIFKLMTKDGGFYQFRYYANVLGWQDAIIPLRENADNVDLPHFSALDSTGSLPSNVTGNFDDVVSIRVEFEGGIAGNGNGKLIDGTTISFEKINFENETIRTEVFLGENMDNGTFCEDHGDNYVFDSAVAPTCTSRGYTKGVCSVCGHIKVKDVKAALTLNNIKQSPDVVDSEQGCETDGVKIGHFVCTIDGCAKDYYAIIEYRPAKGHAVSEEATDPNACTGECGNSLPVVTE